ncbi:MAG: hypothetical protein J3R72DRAFT_446386 [Linnemannia gamsii]|nr:MAG: hypothetical protein J3R72DRAFT_446386 [Linnemannia gamsii]
MLLIVVAFVLALLSAASNAQCPLPTGKTVVVKSETEFCLFLPPFSSSGGIADNEHRAIAFCTKSPFVGAPSAYPFPVDFIRSAHYSANPTKQYVQVTGRIRRAKYCLKSSDQGGQNDKWHPSGAKCAGYNHFVELVEPNENIYCIRCCMSRRDCPINMDTKGCRAVIPGDYS